MISALAGLDSYADYLVSPNMKYLRVDLVGADGSAKELARLEGGEVFIGREPGEGGVTVDNSAVSRQHGVFYRGKNHWLFKDLGSTNGSWLDGKQLKSGAWKFIRDGDMLQMGDSVLRLSEEKGAGFGGQSVGSAIGGRSLVVFAHGNFLDEYPVPEYGRALVVGGSRGDLQLDGDLAELPTLVIERRGEKICAFGLSKDIPVQVNDAGMTDLVALKDSDEIRIGQYSILFCDPGTAARRTTGPIPGTPQRDESAVTKTVEETARLAGVREWGLNEGAASGNFAKTQARIPFGQGEPDGQELDATVAMDPRLMRRDGQGYDRHPSQRYAQDAPSASYSLEALEDKVIIIIGGLLVLAVLVLIMWWFLG